MTFEAVSTRSPLGDGAYVQPFLSFLPFKTFSEKRTVGRANAYENRSFLMVASIFDVDFRAVCRLTGKVLRNCCTRMVLPTGCDADAALYSDQIILQVHYAAVVRT